jgi:hypothetical protein
MLTGTNLCRGYADRVFARSAGFMHSHSWPVNISIRAKFGESAVTKPNASNFSIDKWWLTIECFAIDWPAILNFVSETEKIDAIENHRKSCLDSLQWFTGVCTAPRLHPWDGQELPFSTKAWINIQTGTPEEAQRITQKLFELGYGKSPIHTISTSGKYIFAYAIYTESLN